MIDFASPHPAPLPLLSRPTFVSANKRARVSPPPPSLAEALRGEKMRA